MKEEKIVTLESYKDKGTLEELLPERLYIVHYYNAHNENWLHWEFLLWTGSDDENTYVETMVKGEGPVGLLRECRHSYWGKDGYIFYLQKDCVLKAIEWLSKYYDLD